MSNEPEGTTRRKGVYTGLGLVLGAGAGLVFGAAFGNPGVGMIFGALIGLVFGIAFEARSGRRDG